MADWRVTVQPARRLRVGRALPGKFAHDLHRRLPPGAESSAKMSGIFVYADTVTAAHEVAEIARELVIQYQVAAEVRLDRWHPEKQDWDDDPVFLQQPGPESSDAEYQRRLAEDSRKSEESGVAQWTVRLRLASRDEAADLIRWLAGAGVTGVRHGRTVTAGAIHEDAARQLARLAAQRAPHAGVEVERTFIWVPPPAGSPMP